MSGRGRQILSRFPNHFEAARPGKVLGAVVEALARDLDILAARLAAVRRAHRVGDADEVIDLLRIAALHGISPGELEVLFARFARAEAFAKTLKDAGDAAARDAAAEALIGLWSVGAQHPRLPLFAPPHDGGPADLQAARDLLLATARGATRYDALADAIRGRIAGICAIHARGNGTVQAVLAGAANALDLDIGPVVHSDDRFWHAATVVDRLRLGTLPPAEELIGLEENPLQRVETDPAQHHHGDFWDETRRGFGSVALQVRVKGKPNDRTIGPMIVNCDEGRGVGWFGIVPDGKTLVFDDEGRVLLDGAAVTATAYAWEGACFADRNGARGRDFVFDAPTDETHRPARFITTTPAGALDREAVYPHGEVALPPLTMPVGVTRYAFFIQSAHFNGVDGASVRLVSPRNRAAFFDGSLFEPDGVTPSATVSFSWLEHRPFSARLLIPARFRSLDDDPDGSEIRRRTSLAVERFRPLGIELTVEFIEDRWILGDSVLTGGEGDDAIEKLRSAMALWEQPAPGPVNP